MLTTPELFIWWWLVVVALIPGLWYTVRKRFSDVQPLLFFAVGLGLLYSVTFGNVGLAYRQRAQLLPWLVIIAMVGLEQRELRKSARRRQLFRGPSVPRRPLPVSPTTQTTGEGLVGE